MLRCYFEDFRKEIRTNKRVRELRECRNLDCYGTDYGRRQRMSAQFKTAVEKALQQYNHGPTFKSTRNKSAQDYGSVTSSRYMWSRNKGEDGDLRSFTRLEETGVEGNTPWGHNVHVHGGKKKHGNPDDQISLEEMQTPSRRIKVKTEVTLISTGKLYLPTNLFIFWGPETFSAF